MSAAPQGTTPDVLREAAATAGSLPAARDLAPGEVEALLSSYYREVPAEELDTQRPRDLLGAALSHRTGADQRQAGQTSVRVFTPTLEADGWTTGLSVVEVVTDDMSFLVDSITAELARSHHTVRLLVHPQPDVSRDDEGWLLAVGAMGEDDDGATTVRESWIHVQVAALDDDQRDQVLADVRQVLADVRAAVSDWAPMIDRARDVAAQLGEQPPAGVADDEVDEARRFLDWLVGEKFVFLGYREYAFTGGDRPDEAYLEPVPGTGLGVLRDDGESSERRRTLRGAAARKAADPRLVIITKANSRSTVHRPDYLDYVGVKLIDDDGRVTGEQRFLGLFTHSAYYEPVTEVPYVAGKAREVVAATGYAPDSFLGKDLLRVLASYPRDELFQTETGVLTEVAAAVVHLRRRPRTRLFVRTDDYERFVACLVHLPRDRYSPAVRDRVTELLRGAFDGRVAEHSTQVSESALAQLYVVVRLDAGAAVPDVDVAELESRVAAATRGWEETVAEVVAGRDGEHGATGLVAGFTFPEGYKEDTSAEQAADDLARLAALTGTDVGLHLYLPEGSAPDGRRLKLYRRGELSLSSVLPVFQGLGVEVVDQRPHRIVAADGEAFHVSDFGLRLAWGERWDSDDDGERFQDAFRAVWQGRAESDGFNSLVLLAGLDWRDVVVLRALAAYLRQTGSVFSREYVESALWENPGLTRSLVALFAARFDPDVADRETTEQQLVERINADLDDVASLDQDRILRAFVAVLRAALRTSHYRDDADVLAIKIASQQLADLPAPRPEFEIWVYGPEVEGVHLRFGKVARGGLRWSDRREDFRTEVLGLAKAQMVKNAVITSAGAKGGFVVKHAPDPVTDREGWLAAGRAAYRSFIAVMLDITDNIVDGEVVPPTRVVRHDDDDTYLVVAADKGTATFSDLANEVARDRGFWLDDAFASGGSTGYDHKGMAITARGGWESVKRHFRELGRNVQAEDFTAVGVGDMSGDVFGNGMLRSEHTRLVAAFDHRHVFLDPDPDAATSFAERRRLFDLPRSSWADYDPELISAGGGVHPRTAKTVPVSPQVRESLGLDEDVTELAPDALVRAVLTAPVDLLWYGGIGTYVKASTESDTQVGDPTNDAVRVDGADLRCRVAVEGGNLGVSQPGRVEAALTGVRLNTDAIDNSGGVDSSNHEVNIKILLAAPVTEGRLGGEERDELLASMTEEVAQRVLRQNYEQNVLLSNARTQPTLMIGAYQRFMAWLEERGEFDRALEHLPHDSGLDRRAERGQGLTSPELAVLAAHAKLALKADLVGSDVPDDPWFFRELRAYFPPALRDDYAEDMRGQRLRREIISTRLANALVNRGGITFAYRVTEETGASAAQIARAFVISREIFGLDDFVHAVERLDDEVDTGVQGEMYLEFRRLLNQSVRWFIQHRPGLADVGAEIERFAGPVKGLVPDVPDLLRGRARADVEQRLAELVEAGVPQEPAMAAASLVEQFSLLDVVELAERTGEGLERVAEARYAVEEHLGIDRLLVRARSLPRDARWDALARGALRDDLHTVLDDLTATILTAADAERPADYLAAWDAAHPVAVGRIRDVLDDVEAKDEATLASLSVALRTLRAAAR